jgi:hypothetical protein
MKGTFTTADTEDTEDAQRLEFGSTLCAISVRSVSAVVNHNVLYTQDQSSPLPKKYRIYEIPCHKTLRGGVHLIEAISTERPCAQK